MMKKLLGLIIATALLSCASEVKDYVTIEGTFKESDSDKMFIKGNGYQKEIKIQPDGSFSDTLKVHDEGLHLLSTSGDGAMLFLRNGYDLNIEISGLMVTHGIKFEGKGAETNNYLEAKRLFYLSQNANPKYYFNLDKEAYEKKWAETKTRLEEFKNKMKNLDSTILRLDAENDKRFISYVESNYKKMHEKLLKFKKGNISPVFNSYENYNGGTTSLSDFKGSYVYLDIWASWCAPCKVQFPFLKSLENDYHGKNLKIVSISVDRENAYDTWRNMVKNEELGGIQLIADNNFESNFIKEYDITSIPRFILLDPEGKIVDADAPRPSDEKLRTLFTELGI